jgi:EAL domain-containing protein (putative c-di-GMP-specific phosphodiesterase class I)
VIDLAAEVTDRVNSSALREGSLVTPTVSAGVALWEDGMDATEALRRADTALCDAKATGRRRMVAYDPGMDAAARRRVELEPDLMKALDRGELQVHYQPVVSLEDESVIGAEALVRWDHPTRGLLAPEQWLRDADASGLLESIGEFVLQTAAENFADLNRTGGNPPLHIAVNMSTSELVARQAVRTVQETLRRTGLDPAHLVIEITEDVVLDDATRSTIDRLTDLGISIAIDDFGTGNSSLRQLSGYPARSLKVDRTFVQGMGVNREDTIVVQSILRLARTLGLSTTAEGVESKMQVEMLAELGCNAAQGWYFDRAKPFPELREGRLRALSPLVPRSHSRH